MDLHRYLHRIGLTPDVKPDMPSLEAMHTAHLAAIPFENIDPRLRRPVLLDLASLEAKLVGRRRGGYCFEQNTLFAAALRAVGFAVDTLEARVRPPDAPSPLPRTHMTLRVRVEGRAYLADVGFGGLGPLRPVPMDGTETIQGGFGYATVTEPGGQIALRRYEHDEWRDLYAAEPVPALPVDFEVGSHFTSTHPGSPFVNTLTVQRGLPSARFVLRGRTLTIHENGGATEREVMPEEIGPLLRETFGLDVSDEEARAALGEAGQTV